MVASIKVKGKILREFKDTVYISYGSEYSLLLKNLNIVRSVANVFIDGTNIVPGGLVLNPGQEIDLERSILNGNLNEGNRFKFIERTANIENHRGIKAEDGLIRIEYQFEKVYKRQDGINWKQGSPFTKWDDGHFKTYSSSILRSSASTNNIYNISCSTADTTYNDRTITTQSLSDIGITVPGSKSEQKFVSANWFETEIEKHSIILRLLGETPENETIRNPITVKAKPKCVTCGKQNKATAKFCTECGTHLTIYS